MAAYTDLIMVLGIIIMAAAFPAAVGAFSRSDPPRLAILAVVVGGCMILYATAQTPGGYQIDQMPALFVRVFTGS